MSFEDLHRRKVRYWCFRFRTEAEEGVDASDAPKGLKEKFEEMEWFQGWSKFGVTWDVHEKFKFQIVPRKSTIHEDWDKVIANKFPVIPMENAKSKVIMIDPDKKTVKKKKTKKKKGK